MKKTVLFLGLLGGIITFAQTGKIGVNTDNPTATLDVNPSSTNAQLTATTNEGVLVPRLSKARLQNIASANLVNSTLVYVNDISGASTGTTTDVTSLGFYYYSSSKSKWVKIAEGESQPQDLRLVGNSNHITQDAGVGGNGTNGGGQRNIAIGPLVLYNNQGGHDNVGIGEAVLHDNTTGSKNIGIGGRILMRNTTGSQNTVIGQGLDSNTTGDRNTLIGYGLVKNTTGSNNIVVGHSGLMKNTIGGYNIAIGDGVLSEVMGSRNIGIGTQVLYKSIATDPSIGIGFQTLVSSTTGAKNIAIGDFSMYFNTTGSNNLTIGYGTLHKNTTGNENIALGNNALSKNTTGSWNIAIGDYALDKNTTGNDNIAIKGLGNNTIGVGNIAIKGLISNVSGEYNLAINGMNDNITGSYNTAIGTQNVGNWIKGKYNTQIGTGWANLHLGGPHGILTPELDNVVAIGNGMNDLSPTTGKDHTILLGATDEEPGPVFNKVLVGVGTYKPQVKLDVVGEVRVSSTNSTCTANIEGAIRYNKIIKKFQGCDGTSWVNLN